MVSFNQTTPDTSDPLYIGYSRESSQPHGNEAGKILGQTFGEALTEGAKFYDQHEKKSSDDELHRGMDQLQDERLDNLNTMYAALGGKVVDADGNPVQGTNLFDKNVDKTPEDLKKLDQVAENLRQGKAHGVYDDNYYQMRKDELAKRVRSNHPGYRDYIDAKMKDAEGSTANERAQGLIKSINDLLGQKNTEQDKFSNWAQQHYKYDNVYEAHMNWKANPTPENENEVRKAVATGMGTEHRMMMYDLEQKNRDAYNKGTGDLAVKQFTTLADTAVHNNWEKVNLNYGPFNTAAKAQEAMENLQATGKLDLPVYEKDPNTGKLIPTGKFENREPTQTERNQLQSIMDAAAAKTRKDLEAILSNREAVRDAAGKPTGEYKQSLRERMDPQKAASIVNDRMNFYTVLREQYYNGQGAGVNAMKIANEARVEDGVNGVFKSDLSEFAQRMSTAQKLGGSQAVANILTNTNSSGDLTKGWKSWVSSRAFDMVNNPNDIRSSITRSIHKVNASDETEETKANVIKSLTDLPRSIKDPKLTDSGRRNLIDSSFNSKNNADLMKEFANDTYKNGKLREGKQSVYKRLLDPEMLDQAFKAGPSSWNTVKSWAQDSAVTYMIPSAVKDLQEIQGFRSQYNFAVGYSDKTHQLVLKDGNQPEVNAVYGTADRSAQYGSQLQRSGLMLRASIAINRINDVSTILKNIAEKEGSNPDTYIYDTLQKAGIDTSEFGKEITRAMNFTYSFNPFNFKPEKKTPGVNVP